MAENGTKPSSGQSSDGIVYIIKDEDSLWAALADVLVRKHLDGVQIKIDGWKGEEIRAHGLHYKATVSYSAMLFFCDLQKRLYGGFFLIVYQIAECNYICKPCVKGIIAIIYIKLPMPRNFRFIWKSHCSKVFTSFSKTSYTAKFEFK